MNNELSTEAANQRNLIEQIQLEGPLGIGGAAKCYPLGTHPCTVRRHMSKGYQRPDGTRVYLEHVRIGGKIVTSKKRVISFLTKLNEPCGTKSDKPPSKCEAEAEAEAASQELSAILS